MALADVLHRLVDNSPAFSGDEAVEAHKDITDQFGGDRHSSVPDPEQPDAGVQADEPAPEDKDAEIARLKAELASREG